MKIRSVFLAKSARRLQPNLFRWVFGFIVLGLVAVSCGSDGESEDVFLDTYDTYFQSFSTDYNPSPDVEDLHKRSAVAVEATLVDVEDGRYISFSESGATVDRVFLNLVFQADDNELYYVILPRPSDSSVDQLKSVLPVGSRSVVYLSLNTDPQDGIWFNIREDGNEWFFTTPQGWILDHPEQGVVFPLEREVDGGVFADTPTASKESLGDWLVSEKRG